MAVSEVSEDDDMIPEEIPPQISEIREEKMDADMIQTSFIITVMTGNIGTMILLIIYWFQRRKRNLDYELKQMQLDERHKEFLELSDEALNKRARVTPKGVDELMIEQERSELLHRIIAALPEIQRRRFLLYYEYDFNYYDIAAMEHCTAQAVRRSVVLAREKIKVQMKKYLCP